MERFILCPPDYFQVTKAINDFMKGNEGSVDPKVARTEFDGLVGTLRAIGANVDLLTPTPGLTDQVFMSDPGVTVDQSFFRSSFRNALRQPEAEPMVEYMRGKAYDVQNLPEGLAWEGNGDSLFILNEQGCVDGYLLGGYGIRSDLESQEYLAAQLGLRLIPFEMKEPYFHLDTCLCSLPGRFFVTYPGGYGDDSYKALCELTDRENIYIADEKEAMDFNINVVVCGKDLIAAAMSTRMSEWLCAKGFTVHISPVPSFLKSGGGPKCMTHKLYRRC